MSTTLIACPYCGAYLRVAVQASLIKKLELEGQQLIVKFDDQIVAHICKE